MMKSILRYVLASIVGTVLGLTLADYTMTPAQPALQAPQSVCAPCPVAAPLPALDAPVAAPVALPEGS